MGAAIPCNSGRRSNANATGRSPWLNPLVPHRIAVIPGDGIGKEVIAEAVKMLEAIGGVDLHHLPWGADHYLATGETIPPDGYDTLRSFDAILVGALGDPRVPDNRHARDHDLAGADGGLPGVRGEDFFGYGRAHAGILSLL